MREARFEVAARTVTTSSAARLHDRRGHRHHHGGHGPDVARSPRTWSGARRLRRRRRSLARHGRDRLPRGGLRSSRGHEGPSDLDGRRVGYRGWARWATRWARCSPAAEPRWSPATSIRAERAVRGRARRREAAPSAEAVLAPELDVLAPCAAGGMIDDAMARSIDCRVVAGAANNPLAGRRRGRPPLAERGILYVPDFLANCGGLIHVAAEWMRDEAARRSPLLVAGREECIERAIATAEAEGSDAARGGRAPGARSGRGGASTRSWPAPLLGTGMQRDFEPVATRRTFQEAVEQIAEKVKARRPAHGRPSPLRARAGGADADQPSHAPGGDEGARRGRRARGTPRTVGRHLRGRRAGAARAARIAPGDPRRRDRRGAGGPEAAGAARGPAGRGARAPRRTSL